LQKLKTAYIFLLEIHFLAFKRLHLDASITSIITRNVGH